MNLLSNALKFTPKGGDIQIRSKYLRNASEIDEIDFKDNHQVSVETISSLMQQAKFGIIQISVEDSGTGIKDEN